MKNAVEKSVKAELARLGETVAASPLSVLLLDLARRLDADPEDRAQTMLSREFRLVLAEIYAHNEAAGGDDVERFLESISSPALRGPGD